MFGTLNILLSCDIFLCNLAVRIGIIFLLSGFGGSVLSALFIQNFITVGASGGLFGLLGAMLSELFTNWTLYTNKVSQANLSIPCCPRLEMHQYLHLS